MLLGYREDTGAIEFLFSDTAYLKKQFPKNSAKISNFWKIDNHGLKEYFTDAKQFPDFYNYKNYKIVIGELIKKSNEEIKTMQEQKQKVLKERIIKVGPDQQRGKGLVSLASAQYVKSLEDRIKKLEEKE